MDIRKFDEIMDIWAQEEAQAAELAKSRDDERGRSIALMKQSMYSTMLRTLGHNAPHAMEGCIKDLEKRLEKQRSLGDADSADRIGFQIGCIRKVQQLVRELGGNI